MPSKLVTLDEGQSGWPPGPPLLLPVSAVPIRRQSSKGDALAASPLVGFEARSEDESQGERLIALVVGSRGLQLAVGGA